MCVKVKSLRGSVCVCVHICVWSTSGILSLLSLCLSLSATFLSSFSFFCLFFYSTKVLYKSNSIHVYQPLCFYGLRASLHLFSFYSVVAERSDFAGMILTATETVSNGAGLNSDAGVTGEKGKGESKLNEGADSSGG